ncbi:MAG: hypothetical protein MJ152_00865 [Clostridia bacterium]|nr:hypothetical protein [Clostridia bacterium]
MKKLDLVKLINEKPYIKNNLQKDMHGIIITLNADNADVMFFNPHNIGNYAKVNVKLLDISLDKEKLPMDMQEEILSNMDKIITSAKSYLEPIKINEYEMVELLVEDDKYTKFGIHKGDRGCVMDNKAVQNYILVDFSGIDENGNFYGDCISVKIEDLKIIK